MGKVMEKALDTYQELVLLVDVFPDLCADELAAEQIACELSELADKLCLPDVWVAEGTRVVRISGSV